MLQAVRHKVLNEPIFFTAIVLAILSSFFGRPNLQAIDWKVIIVLFNLMAIISALEKYQVLDKISFVMLKRVASIRYLSFCLVFLTGFFAMFVTNDVALLTMVPLTILIAKRCKFNPAWIIIYQTLAANVGSSLTPMGNPQNLFLYEHFHIRNIEFIAIVLPLVIIGNAVIGLFMLKFPVKAVNYKLENKDAKTHLRRQIFYLLIFVLAVLSVLRLFDYRVMFIVVLFVILFLDWDIFLRIDYFLLGTFVAFFLFVSSVSQIPGITNAMSGLLDIEGGTFLWGVLSSQIISNVPAAVLLANFTGDYRELLLGVNVGGMGTLIASLASLISYKLYRKEYPDIGYLAKFHIVSFAVLFFLFVIFYLMVRYF